MKGSKDAKEYALKDLQTRDPEDIKRFKRDIRVLSRIDHPNVVRIYKWQLKGIPSLALGPWYVMEHLPGGSLYDYLRRTRIPEKRFTISQVILPICVGLEYAYAQGIYHRDLKPSNLMFADQEHSVIKIIDWELGKATGRQSTTVTGTGGVGGTREYCAPEQWLGQVVDARVDIFSLGVIMYEMLTGICPGVYDDLGRPLNVQSPSHYQPTIVTELDQIVMKAIQMDPANRFQSMGELIAALRSLPPDQANQGG